MMLSSTCETFSYALKGSGSSDNAEIENCGISGKNTDMFLGTFLSFQLFSEINKSCVNSKNVFSYIGKVNGV